MRAANAGRHLADQMPDSAEHNHVVVVIDHHDRLGDFVESSWSLPHRLAIGHR